MLRGTSPRYLRPALVSQSRALDSHHVDAPPAKEQAQAACGVCARQPLSGADEAGGQAAAVVTPIAYDEPPTGDQQHELDGTIGFGSGPELAVDVERFHRRPAERRGPDRQGRRPRCRPTALGASRQPVRRCGARI
jgi:hypothetical protein